MITNKLKELAELRKELSQQKIDLDIYQSELEKTPQYQYLVAQKLICNTQSSEIEQLEKEIRELAVAQFDGQNKKPFKGIEIKEFSVVKVLDEKKALIWASQNAPSILKLDQAKFKKAVENLELDFVEKGVEYKGQIASDLSEYLK